MKGPIFLRGPDGSCDRWDPTTLLDIGLQEKDLEKIVAEDLDILGLRKSELWYDHVATFTQVTLPTPDGRRIRLDLAALTDAGDVVIVEVKRHGNFELRGREVAAQIVDYAATLSYLDHHELARRFDTSRKIGTFADIIRARLPSVKEVGQLAKRIRRRFADGELVLVIACDRAPAGAEEWIQAVTNQSALGFQLRLVEITPYVCNARPGEVIFSGATVVETEIISRTAVTIRNEVGTDRVQVAISVDSPDRIEEHRLEATRRRGKRTYPESLRVVEDQLELSPDTLEDELRAISQAALGEDWSQVYDALAWPITEQEPYLRWTKRGRYHDGRLGVDLVKGWKPSFFVGVMVDGGDHKVEPSEQTLGADFVLIVSISRKAGQVGMDGDTFMEQPEFHELRNRLRVDSGDWDFHDHLSSLPYPNRWHPIHLRRPLAKVFAETSDPAERRVKWFEAASSAIEVVLKGDELSRLRDRLVAQE